MKNNEELSQLKEKCLLILDYLEHNEASASPIIAASKSVVQKSFDSKNLRGLKVVLGDLIEWANGLSEKDFSGLSSKYLNTFNEHINSSNSKLIKKIIKKGIISNEEEYRVLQNYVGNVGTVDDATISKVNVMLQNFQG